MSLSVTPQPRRDVLASIYIIIANEDAIFSWCVWVSLYFIPCDESDWLLNISSLTKLSQVYPWSEFTNAITVLNIQHGRLALPCRWPRTKKRWNQRSVSSRPLHNANLANRLSIFSPLFSCDRYMTPAYTAFLEWDLLYPTCWNVNLNRLKESFSLKLESIMVIKKASLGWMFEQCDGKY